MAYDRVRAQQNLLRLAKAGPAHVKGPVGRATRRFRGSMGGPLVTVVLPVSDDETTRIDPLLHSLRAQTHRNLDVVVVPYGRHEDVVEVAVRHAAEDWRIRVRRRPSPSLAAARNAGVASARGHRVVVVGGGDEVPDAGIAALVRSTLATGSPLVVGRMGEPDTAGWTPDAPYDTAHHVEVLRTSLRASPVAVTDLGLGNKMFTTELWRSVGARFRDDDEHGTDVVLRLLTAAESFDLLTEPTYVPVRRRDGVGVGTMPDVLSNLEQWSAEHRRTWRTVEALGIEEASRWWLWGVLDSAIQPLVADVERADDVQWRTLRELVGLLLGSADDALWASLSAESRIKLWLVEHGHRDRLEEFAAARLFTGGGNRPTTVSDGRVWAALPFHDDEELGIPRHLYEMTEAETRFLGWLREVRWTADDEIEMTVFAAIDFVGMDDLPTVSCRLVERASGAAIELPIRQYRDHRANQGGRRHQDHSWGAFVATVPVRELVDRASTPSTWLLDVSIAVEGVARSGPVSKVDLQGSAGFMAEDHLAPRPVAGAMIGFTRPSALAGLRITADRGLRLSRVEVEGRTVSGVLDCGDRAVAGVRIRAGARQVAAAVTTTGTAVSFRATVPPPWTGQRSWTLEAVLPDNAVHPVGWPGGHDQWLGAGVGELVASRAASGGTHLLESAGVLTIDRVAVDDLVASATGRWLGAPDPEATIALVGPSVTVPGSVQSADDGSVTVRFALEHDRWGLGARPLPVGVYWIEVTHQGTTRRGILSPVGIDRLHHFEVGSSYAVRMLRDARDCGIELLRPIETEDRVPFGQQRLQDWLADCDLPIDEDAVYLQSYVGASATDSQLAIHEELRRVRPDLRLIWGVTDASAWVPEGAHRVTINTPEWYRALATSKYLCLNIDPERWFSRRPGQRLLQTFHGYPAKSMGLRMWRAKHFTPRRIDLELARTSGGWDLILTPAPEMDEHYRREYAYDGPILSQGYPRDDDLVTDRALARREETRARLGIQPHQKVVLYAPTWRDDLATNWRSAVVVEHLDMEKASKVLGPDYVLLMRGHRFHAEGANASGPAARIVDVTTYPEINDLIAAADAAVLDYSSLRFDFALTGRPMVFLVPDLDSYVGGVRGFLYDYRDSAPGPLVDTSDETVNLLRDLDALAGEWGPEIARFNATYNRLQDGRAAARAAAALLALG